jgi:hypothetical protein
MFAAALPIHAVYYKIKKSEDSLLGKNGTGISLSPNLTQHRT